MREFLAEPVDQQLVGGGAFIWHARWDAAAFLCAHRDR